jgi:outer membrane protein OmpA-like peptidoglycan-associated protein
MGRIFKVDKFTTMLETIILCVVVSIVLTGVYMYAPGLKASLSKQMSSLDIDTGKLDNVTEGKLLPLPSKDVSSSVSGQPVFRIAEYAWNGNSGMIVANGGPKTTEGSLMEAAGVNLEIVRQDMVGGLRDMQIKFVEEYDSGTPYPTSKLSAFAVSIMGDGVPFYITTLQNSLDAKFGKGKYHAQNIAPIGMSNGEDKLIGPKIWKDNPQSMKGCVISSVIGDGDWVIAVNYASLNKINVNPDPTTYDANAINFVGSKDDDYINSVKELIASQKNGTTVPLAEVVNGERTGKTINHKIDGATTWTPGDKMAFDALSGFTDVASTKEFTNQMATSIIVIKEFALAHEKEVKAILSQTYIANNQIKLYDSWAVRASEAVAETYGFESPKYWYDMFKGQTATKDGVEYSIGGTSVLNYADALQYVGMGEDNKNRYKSVYEQVSFYLTDLNPCDFNGTAKEGVIPYDDAVNYYFLSQIKNSVFVGEVKKIDYSEKKTKVMASGHWNINYAVGSTDIQGSDKDLETIYNLLVQAETTKLSIVGHTDNTGNPQSNITLSKGRANSVVEALVSKGISRDRFQLIDGKGSNDPIGDNASTSGKAQNRRVDITLLK